MPFIGWYGCRGLVSEVAEDDAAKATRRAQIACLVSSCAVASREGDVLGRNRLVLRKPEASPAIEEFQRVPWLLPYFASILRKIVKIMMVKNMTMFRNVGIDGSLLGI
jgi:hypothetical protein